jgi:DHA2 family multidrug resistance protein-like MFS transporter
MLRAAIGMMNAAGRRLLAILALPCLLYSMDLTVLNLAIPHITPDLKPDGGQMLWIMDIYGFVLAGTLIMMGALGDRIGRRLLLMVGAVAFGVASIFAAFSTVPRCSSSRVPAPTSAGASISATAVRFATSA